MRDKRFLKRLILFTGLLLLCAAALPLYTLPHQNRVTETMFSWQLAREDGVGGLWLACVFLWPWAVVPFIGAAPGTGRRRIGIVFAPLLAAWSVVILLAVQAGAFTYEPIFPILPVPWVVVAGSIGAGAILAYVADGAFLLGCLAAGLINARRWWSGRNRTSGPAIHSASV